MRLPLPVDRQRCLRVLPGRSRVPYQYQFVSQSCLQRRRVRSVTGVRAAQLVQGTGAAYPGIEAAIKRPFPIAPTPRAMQRSCLRLAAALYL